MAGAPMRVEVGGYLLVSLLHGASALEPRPHRTPQLSCEGILLGRRGRGAATAAGADADAALTYIDGYAELRGGHCDAWGNALPPSSPGGSLSPEEGERAIGFYVVRTRGPPQPSIRELAAARALAKREMRGGASPLTNFLLLVVVANFQEQSHIQSFKYQAYEVDFDVPSERHIIPCDCIVRNLTSDPETEYKQFQSFQAPTSLLNTLSRREDELLSIRAQSLDCSNRLFSDVVASLGDINSEIKVLERRRRLLFFEQEFLSRLAHE